MHQPQSLSAENVGQQRLAASLKPQASAQRTFQRLLQCSLRLGAAVCPRKSVNERKGGRRDRSARWRCAQHLRDTSSKSPLGCLRGVSISQHLHGACTCSRSQGVHEGGVTRPFIPWSSSCWRLGSCEMPCRCTTLVILLSKNFVRFHEFHELALVLFCILATPACSGVS